MFYLTIKDRFINKMKHFCTEIFLNFVMAQLPASFPVKKNMKLFQNIRLYMVSHIFHEYSYPISRYILITDIRLSDVF